MKNKTKKFPDTIYIQREDEGTVDEFLIASEDIKNADEGKVAVYKLVEVKKVWFEQMSEETEN